MAAEPRIIGSKRLRDAWPPVSEDEVQLPSGARRTWIRMHLGTSAAILAVTKEKEIVLTREYRHGLGRIAFSLPGGTENAIRPRPWRYSRVNKIGRAHV